MIRYAKIHGTKHRPWLRALLARRPTKVAAIALANKIARMVWAISFHPFNLWKSRGKDRAAGRIAPRPMDGKLDYLDSAIGFCANGPATARVGRSFTAP